MGVRESNVIAGNKQRRQGSKAKPLHRKVSQYEPDGGAGNIYEDIEEAFERYLIRRDRHGASNKRKRPRQQLRRSFSSVRSCSLRFSVHTFDFLLALQNH